MIKFFLAFVGIFSVIVGFGQELNCKVVVNADQIQTTERDIFEEMETEFTKFMNTTKWTNDEFQEHEVIRCNIIITINEMPSIGQFKASVQILSARPVFGTDYESVLFNYGDKNFDFEYVKFQPLRFTENTYTNNITSLLSYYAYMILGFDYDSFSELGGTPYFQKAFAITTNAQQSGYSGWDQFSSINNRYWLIENMRNTSLEPIRKSLYSYHINGLDLMYRQEDYKKGEKNILNTITNIYKANRVKPRSPFVITLMNAKNRELVQLFSQADIATKRQAYELLKEIDPSRNEQYAKIIK